MAKVENDRKAFDRDSAVDYLGRLFERASDGHGPRSKATAGTALYGFQVDFAYLIDEIQRGPEASAKHAFAQAKRLIGSMEVAASPTA